MSRLLMLHAFPMDERMWNRQRESLQPHEVMAPRLYGRGSSFDEWGASLLDEVHGDFIAVGASMGGYAALAIARLAAARLLGLVLVGSRVERDSPDRLAQRAATLQHLREQGAAAVWNPEDLSIAPPTEDLTAAVEALRDRPDATTTVQTLACPLLVLVGDSDPLMGLSEGERLAALAPSGSFTPIAGAGHLATLDQPAAFETALSSFLDDL